jgi:hypothetical protein
LSDQFRICQAPPLEQDRYQLTLADVAEHFHRLNSLYVSEYDPHLVINLDETGFSASKSWRSKSARALVPTDFEKKPVREEVSESHFVSALAAMTLTGDVLLPGLIKGRSTDHPDESRASYYEYAFRYSSEKAFATRSIFGDYL